MEIQENNRLCALTDQLRLQILIFGLARTDDGWGGDVPPSPFSRLYRLESGELEVSGPTGAERLRPGRWYLFPAGWPYSYRCGRGIRHFYFHFRVTDVGGIDLMQSCKSLLCLGPGSETPAALKACLRSGRPADGLRLRQLIWGLLLPAVERGEIPLAFRTVSPCVQQATEYVGRHLSARLTVDEVARHAYVSKSTLNRHFQQELSFTVNRYLFEQVMAEAEQLVRQSRLPLSAVSERLGFTDPFYFSRRFKEKFGLSPREYRKSVLP